MPRFIPVKILDQKWADKLLDGEVYMRPLYEIGGWGRAKKPLDKQLDNNYRGDLHEGASFVFSKGQDCDHIDNLDSGLAEIAKQVNNIDDDAQFFKVYCLYCLEYDSKHDFFFKPDSRMREFGDTAVIIKDTCEFIERVGKALFKLYEHFTGFLHPVGYYSYNTTRPTNWLFEKHESYAYQNELRFAFGQIVRNMYALGPDADNAMRLVKDTARVTLQIGSIRDIACAIRMDDFLALRFPPNIKLRWPMSDDKENSSNYDKLVQLTYEQMKYNPIRPVRTMLEIW